MLDPERAILVERGDALVWWHELLACLVRSGPHEVKDSLLRRSVIPRWQYSAKRRGLCLRGLGKECSESWKQCQCRKQKATVDSGGRNVRFHVCILSDTWRWRVPLCIPRDCFASGAKVAANNFCARFLAGFD